MIGYQTSLEKIFNGRNFIEEGVNVIPQLMGPYYYDLGEKRLYLKTYSSGNRDWKLAYDVGLAKTYFPEEIEDVIKRYHRRYRRIKLEAISQSREIPAMELAGEIYTGLYLFYYYSHAFFAIRNLISREIKKGTISKPENWNESELKYQNRFQFVYQRVPNNQGKIYLFDDIPFSEEVFQNLTTLCSLSLLPYPVEYNGEELIAWDYIPNIQNLASFEMWT